MGHGFAQTVGRIGGIIGSQMQMVHDAHSAAPYAVYGALLVITAVMIYFLEETRDEPLKDLLEDGKANRERYLFFLFYWLLKFTKRFRFSSGFMFVCKHLFWGFFNYVVRNQRKILIDLMF